MIFAKKALDRACWLFSLFHLFISIYIEWLRPAPSSGPYGTYGTLFQKIYEQESMEREKLYFDPVQNCTASHKYDGCQFKR